MKEFVLNNWFTILLAVVFAVYLMYRIVYGQWEKLRADAYRFILQAEKVITGSKRGKEKFEQVFTAVYSIVPPWLRFFFPADMVREQMQFWYVEIKDVLDDGKKNGSQDGKPPDEIIF